MIIYKIVNQVNGKFYVGKTTKSIEERFAKHRYNHSGGNTYLYRSMRKYGFENFLIEVLEHVNHDLDEREKFWIRALKPEYNMTEGGDGGDTSSSPNFLEAIAKHHANRTEYPGGRMRGKTHSEETKLKQSSKRKEFWSNMSKEDREVRSKTISGSSNGMFGKTPKNSVRVTYDGVEYPSVAAASRNTGHSPNYIKKHGVLHNE